MGTTEVDEIWPDWQRAVNLDAEVLERWLDTAESRTLGETGDDEVTGHSSGRRSVHVLRTARSDLTRADVAHMKVVVGHVHEQLAHRPDGDVTDTPWRYSLMNWGHDPLQDS